MPIMPLLAGGAAIAGALSARARNKRIPRYEPQPFSGYRPPHVQFLRPVESQITDIAMRRSRGEDVGFDPSRRDQLQEMYDIEQGRRGEDQDADIQNRLSGMGLSRNLAATQELLGRAQRERERERNLYTRGINVEDLMRRNEERDINTARLQALNSMNFGQENNVAGFDRSIWEAEQGNQARAASLGMQAADMYEDPFASAIESGISGYALGQQINSQAAGQILGAGGGGSPMPATQTPSTGNPTTWAIMQALKRKGKNLAA